MTISNSDKQALMNNAVTLSRISIVGTDTIFTEEDNIVDWTLEDFRYVPNNGFIGQFVERLLNLKLKNVPPTVNLADKEFKLELGVRDNTLQTDTYYSFGTFMVTNVGEADTTGIVSIEASDLTKKFNVSFQPDESSFPMTALELLNGVCDSVGITLATDGLAACYCVPKNESLQAGTYAFRINNQYYTFTTTQNLQFLDSLMFVQNKNAVIQKRIYEENDNIRIERVELEVTKEATTPGTLIDSSLMDYVDFANNDFVIENSQYDADDTCRKVIADIAKLAYSWARIGVDDKLYIDFTPKEEVMDDFNKITTNEFYENISATKEIGPINKIVIGLSNVDGENVYLDDYFSPSYPNNLLYPQDTLYPNADDTHDKTTTLKILDNNLTNTQYLRRIAILDSVRLFGLKYMPLKINTIGHPWLEGDDLISVTTLDGTTYKTYPFDRTLTYSGFLKGSISSEGENNTEFQYEFHSDTLRELRKTQISVDKANQRIEAVAQESADNFARVVQNIDGVVTSVQSSGGSNKIVNSVGYDNYNEWTPTFDEGVTETSPTIQSVELKEKTVSGSALVLNGYKISQEIFVKANMNYAFSCLVSKNNLNTSTGYIRIYDKNNPSKEWRYDLQANRSYNYHKVEFGSENPIRITGTVIVVEFYGTQGSDMFITDSILNQGDYTSVWEQANGEILGSQVKVTKDGIRVQSSTSSNETVINSEEFAGYGDVRGVKTKVFTINGNQTDVYSLKSRHDINMPPLKVLSITGSSDNGWAIVGDE